VRLRRCQGCVERQTDTASSLILSRLWRPYLPSLASAKFGDYEFGTLKISSPTFSRSLPNLETPKISSPPPGNVEWPLPHLLFLSSVTDGEVQNQSYTRLLRMLILYLTQGQFGWPLGFLPLPSSSIWLSIYLPYLWGITDEGHRILPPLASAVGEHTDDLHLVRTPQVAICPAPRFHE